MKKIFFSVIIILLATLNLSAEILEIEKNGYKLLYNTDKESYSFEINGVDWPLYAQKDNVSGVRLKGTNRVRAQSIFSLVVIDTSLDKRIALNSKVADSISYERFDDTKLCITYSFDEGITVPVVFSIDEEGLHISIDTLSIKEEAPVYVFEIALLPCFSSSSLLDDGFFLIPDGEGALLRFNSGRSGTYNEPVYGQDQTISSDVKLTNKETIRLPLFGVSRNGNALIAVIENSSAAIARVVASSSSSSSPYNSCYFNFILRSSIEESISDDAFQVKYEEDRVFNGTISILIKETEDNLASMAETFSSFFIPASEYRLEEDFIIHWNVAESENIKVFGIPLPLKKSISTLKYDDVYKIIEALSEYGSVHLNLENWNSDEIFLRHVDSISFISSAGSDNDRKELFESAWGGGKSFSYNELREI